MPDKEESKISAEVKKVVQEAMKQAQPILVKEIGSVIDRGVDHFTSAAQDVIGDISGGNPFIESALNTTLNYSRAQMASQLIDYLNKHKG